MVNNTIMNPIDPNHHISSHKMPYSSNPFWVRDLEKVTALDRNHWTTSDLFPPFKQTALPADRGRSPAGIGKSGVRFSNPTRKLVEILRRYKPVWNLDLKLKPMLLGGVMKSSGNSPPAVVPNKGVYMAQDLRRLQKFFQVPLFLPENLMDLIMKGGSLNAQRFITAVDMVKPEHLENISKALWERLYEQHKDISKSSSFIEAGESVGMEKDVLDKVISFANDDKVKQRLRKYTEDALEYGAFGAPIIVAHVNNKPEVFFGSDRFELMAHVLGKKWLGPVPEDVPPSKL